MILLYDHQYYWTVTFLLDVIIVEISREILVILRYYFKLADKAVSKIWEVEGNETIPDCVA